MLTLFIICLYFITIFFVPITLTSALQRNNSFPTDLLLQDFIQNYKIKYGYDEFIPKKAATTFKDNFFTIEKAFWDIGKKTIRQNNTEDGVVSDYWYYDSPVSKTLILFSKKENILSKSSKEIFFYDTQGNKRSYRVVEEGLIAINDFREWKKNILNVNPDVIYIVYLDKLEETEFPKLLSSNPQITYQKIIRETE